ncbi:hypothetical protein RJU59_02250 [Buchnera aphidicola (Kurisakia onigurumii)]|uniref:hypothetical protein n=1 Tax=Buchnera aphidicola TaxID=9 RepID=UPI0031B6E898
MNHSSDKFLKIYKGCNINSLIRKNILLWFFEKNIPITKKKLSDLIGIKGIRQNNKFNLQLKKMILKKELRISKKLYFFNFNFNSFIIGQVIGNSNRYGFLKKKNSEDLFWISEKEMNFCIHKDIVLSYIIKKKKKKEVKLLF